MSKTVFTWGRMNPPTVGHQKLVDKVKSEAKKLGAMAHVYISHSQDSKKNPLSYADKFAIARKAFGPIVKKSESKTIIQVMKELEKMGHTDVVLVVGSDRVREFKTFLPKYNGKDYNFKSIKVVSAGARDPDADGVSGMSASKMRAAAQSGDYASFKKGTPKSMSEKEKKDMYDKIRSVMEKETNESIEWDDIDFEFTDDELDAFIEMTDLDALEEEVEIDEEYGEYLESLGEERKPLTVQQRMAIGRRMKRLAPRISRMRKIRMKRMADRPRLEKRARKAAIKLLRKRFAGKQGENYASLTPAAKMQVDRVIQKKMAAVGRISKRLLPKVRKAEMERLKNLRKGKSEPTKKAVREEFIWEEEDEKTNQKLITILRQAFTDPKERNLVIRALKGGERSLKNPKLRPFVLKLLTRLLDATQDDPSMLAKMRDKLRRMSQADNLKEREDPDIGHRKGSQPAQYHTGLSKSTKKRRDAHFRKYAEKPGDKNKKDSDANYKPAPGDARAKTKPSIHTKKYKQMYGEDDPCWDTHKQVGMKKKGNRMVPNCVPKEDLNASFEKFLEEEYIEEKIAGLVKKSEKSGIPYGILKQVYNRGMAAWKSGHRPGATPQQWAFARVNSFITKGSGTWGKADKDLAAKVRGSKARKESLDKEDEPKVKEIIKKLKGASKAHAGQAKDLEKAVKEDAVKDAKDDIKREKEIDKRKHDAMLDRARLQKAKMKNRMTEAEHSDEIEVDGYQTKNFHMCGSAQKVMKKLAGKEGAKELTQMQDKFYGLEKQIMNNGSADKKQKATARMMHDRIMAKAKQVGLDDEIGGYMKMHIDSIEKGKPKLGFGRTDIKESIDEKFESLFLEEPRVPRKPGQPAGSDKHSDLYTDENPKDTIHGLKFATVKDAEASVKKIKSSGRKHAHKIQAAIAMEQRARVAGKKSAAAVYRAYINAMKKKTKQMRKEEYGAGEEGTDKLVKKYKKDTPNEDCTCFDHVISEAEYKGRKVTLNDPIRSNDGKKKFYVYVKNEKGNIVKVGFGDPNMEIKRDDPGRRKNFRARHNCDNPGPKWKARYWSCYQWRAGAKVDN